jgi:putative photosynthetic complex assembly protein 2
LFNPWLAVVVALFLWWFLTGIILFLVNWADNQNAGIYRKIVLSTSPIFVLGLLGFVTLSNELSLLGVYGSFISALAIWGWFELAFLSGILTGPNTLICPAEVRGWMRFRLALASVAYSEIILLVSLVILMWMTADAVNKFGFLTFFVLYVARFSAKINLFLGVPRINVEFLPNPVKHLASHFRRCDINWFFPISITSLSILVAIWFEKSIAQPPLSISSIGFSLLATLTLLALLEHWFMVLPLPDAKLWRWMIPTKSSSSKVDLT